MPPLTNTHTPKRCMSLVWAGHCGASALVGELITQFHPGSGPAPRCEGALWILRLLAPLVAALESGDEWRPDVGGRTRVRGWSCSKDNGEVIHKVYLSLCQKHFFLLILSPLLPLSRPGAPVPWWWGMVFVAVISELTSWANGPLHSL